MRNLCIPIQYCVNKPNLVPIGTETYTAYLIVQVFISQFPSFSYPATKHLFLSNYHQENVGMSVRVKKNSDLSRLCRNIDYAIKEWLFGKSMIFLISCNDTSLLSNSSTKDVENLISVKYFIVMSINCSVELAKVE